SPMQDKNSLAHTQWRCKYHIVFAPKYRRQIIYGKYKKSIGGIIRELCERKGVEIHEANACKDLIATLVSIPPKLSVSQFIRHGLDPTSLIWIREIIRELSDQKTTVFLSSHNLNELDRMTRHIFFLKDGQMIYRDLVEHQNFSYLIRVRDQPDFEKYQRLVSKVINQHQFIVAKDKLNQVITL